MIIFSNVALGNKIDELKTDKDVEDFIKAVAPEFVKKVWKDFDHGNFRIVSTDSIYSYLKCQKIIDEGNSNFKLTRFNIDFDVCEYVKPIKVQDKNELQIRKVNLPLVFDENIEKYIKIDTLTYKYDFFIELNEKAIIDNRIKSIEIKRNYCFGTCPVFTLIINKNGLAEFDGIAHIKFKGKSIKQIDIEKINEIVNLLNYIEIKKLEDNYSVNYTDAPTATLDIFFEDGSLKRITDYGLSGTYGLSALYSKLTKLGTETKWE